MSRTESQNRTEICQRMDRDSRKVFWKRDLVLDLDRVIENRDQNRTEQRLEERIGIAKRVFWKRYSSELVLELG